MWIEFNINGSKGLLNSATVSLIHPAASFITVELGAGGNFQITAASREDSLAILHGFNVALNGHDFAYGEDGYIRPILQAKQERLYEFMKRQEFISDRR